MKSNFRKLPCIYLSMNAKPGPSSSMSVQKTKILTFQHCRQPGYFTIKGVILFVVAMYLLVKFALFLLVATTSVERAFMVINIIKSVLCNRMGDEFINVCLVAYIEQDIFNIIETYEVMQYFQNMKSC